MLRLIASTESTQFRRLPARDMRKPSHSPLDPRYDTQSQIATVDSREQRPDVSIRGGSAGALTPETAEMPFSQSRRRTFIAKVARVVRSRASPSPHTLYLFLSLSTTVLDMDYVPQRVAVSTTLNPRCQPCSPCFGKCLQGTALGAENPHHDPSGDGPNTTRSHAVYDVTRSSTAYPYPPTPRTSHPVLIYPRTAGIVVGLHSFAKARIVSGRIVSPCAAEEPA